MAERRSRTARDARRRALAQNFLRSRAAERLVRDAAVQAGDVVLELGAGTGVLTAALARRAGRVLVVELDPDWARRLLEQFAENQRVFVIQGDALAFPLPGEYFRVVANLPFNRTTAALKCLLDPANALVRADVVVQAEVARRLPGSSSARAARFHPAPSDLFPVSLPPSCGSNDGPSHCSTRPISRASPPSSAASSSNSRRSARRPLDDWIERFQKLGPLP